MTRAVFSLNAGSSSVKFALFALTAGEPKRIAGGKLEGIGTEPRLTARDEHGAMLTGRRWENGAGLTHEQLLDDLFRWVDTHLPRHRIVAMGHRVVHGGTRFSAPVLVDDAVLAVLDNLAPLAPLHQPHNLAAVRAVRRRMADLPQVACFDTAFHHAMPDVATRLALPRMLGERGIRRYGFHGLSYEYIARRLRRVDPGLAAGRVIAAHLGNGASMCAMADGGSIDTTMGFTALDGLMMGTRCGTLDPGVVLHLQQQEGMSAKQVETLLYKQSGLLGVSDLSNDMRTLHASADPRAAEAIELFVWRAAREAGALVSSLGGLDGMVFTAGIGENDAIVRRMICERLAWAGVRLDEHANAVNAPTISAPDSNVTVRVMPTDEEWMIARHTVDIVGQAS